MPRWLDRRAVAEALETRTLLSVSNSTLAGPTLVTGNTWTYNVTSGTDTATVVTTVKGPTTFNGRSVVQLDMNQSRQYVGLDADGNYVSYGGFTQYGTIAQSDVYDPFQVGLPASMSAGVTYSFDYTDRSTQTTNGTTLPPDVSRDNVKVTLASETPQPVTVKAGTFDAYKVTTVLTSTSPGIIGADVSTVDQWYAPGVGMVQSSGSNGIVYKLASFSAQQDHLGFAQQPTAAEAGEPVAPPVAVSVFDAAGNVDADATGTITLSLASFPRSGPGALSGTLTRPVAGGVAVFDDLSIDQNGRYRLRAESSDGGVTGVDSNDFRVGPSDLAFEINSRTNARSKKGVVTGDVILYSVLVTPKLVVDSQTITIDLPAGLVPNNLTGGATFAGHTITCTVSTARAINFDLVVPDAKTLSEALNGATDVVLTGNADLTYADGSTDAGTAESRVAVAIDRSIKGKLTDALFQYPRRAEVPTSHGLAGVEVALVDAAGAAVATVKTGKSGAYAFVAPKGGTYTVRASAVADAYDSAADGLTVRRMYGGRQVTVEQANMVPVDLGTTVLPVTFMKTSAALLLAMNHYTTSGFQGLSEFKIDLFRFDTTAAEAALAAMAGTEASPTALLDPAALKPSAAVDPWVAAMRMMAGLAETHERFTDTFRLTDQAGKSLAVAAAAEVAKRAAIGTGKLLKKYPNSTKLPNWLGIQASSVDKKLNAAGRIAGFTALGLLLSPALDLAGVKPETKSKVMAVTFNVLRYASEAVTGNLIPDLAFETVFNFVRIAFDASLLKVLGGVRVRTDLPSPYGLVLPVVNAADSIGVLPGSAQSVVNDLVARRAQYDPATDTSAVLRNLDDFDDYHRRLAIAGTARTAIVNSINSVIRGGDGILQIQKAVNFLNPKAVPASAFQRTAHAMLSQLDKGLTKAPGGGGLKQVQLRVQLAVFAVAADSVIRQLVGTAKIPDIVARGNWVRPAGTPTSVPAVPPAPATPAAAATHGRSVAAMAPRAVPLAAAVDPATTATYLADLSRLAGLVKRKDAAGADALYPQIAAAETALLDDLSDRAAAAAAVAAQLGKKDDALVGQLLSGVERAVTATLLAQAQLGTWGLDPATGDAKAVAGQLKRAAAAVKAAAGLADRVRALAGGLVAPPALAIESADVPLDLAVGATATLRFTVTNVGGAATAAGTIGFTNGNGALVVQAPADQPLPALAPGASAELTWQVVAAAPTAADAGSVYQLTAVVGDLRSVLTGEITVG